MTSDLFTFSDLKRELPVSERTLRDILARLGFRRRPGCRRLVFTQEHFDKIKDEIVCVTVNLPAPPGSRHFAFAARQPDR